VREHDDTITIAFVIDRDRGVDMYCPI